MSADQVFAHFFKELLDEIKRNPELKRKLVTTLIPILEHEEAGSDLSPSPKRAINRRKAAVLDPIQICRLGDESLRNRLAQLDIEQLRDIVAQYGMDTGKLVMKWKDPQRVIDRIVEVAEARAQKGNAFKEPSNDPEAPEESSVPLTPPPRR